MSNGFVPYINILRNLEFIKDFEMNSKYNGREMQYKRCYDSRRIITVQLWARPDEPVIGRACSSFKALKDLTMDGSSDTAPTDFRSTFEMIRAIIHEADRTDGKYCLPGSLPSENLWS